MTDIKEHPLFPLAKKIGDNLTYGQIIKLLESYFLLKQKVKEVIDNAIKYDETKEVMRVISRIQDELGLE